MIGAKGLLYDALPLIPLIVFLLFIINGVRHKGGWKRAPVIVFCLLFAFFAELFCEKVGLGAWYLVTMSRIRPDQVEAVMVGDQTVSTPQGIAAIVRALNSSRWFSSDHGGWAKEVQLTIKMKGAREHSFLVARYLRQPGVVVQKELHLGPITVHTDCGFCPDLIDAFEQAGVGVPYLRESERP